MQIENKIFYKKGHFRQLITYFFAFSSLFLHIFPIKTDNNHITFVAGRGWSGQESNLLQYDGCIYTNALLTTTIVLDMHT